jgi:cell division protein FtsB
MKKFLKGHRFILIALAVFLVLVTFVDKNNLVDNWQLRGKIRALEAQREFYRQRIYEDSVVLENLRDPRFLEQYAREQFYMHRAGEEVYLVR